MIIAPMRRYAVHLAIFLAVQLVVHLPRLGGFPAELTAPIFGRDRGYLDFDEAYYPAGRAITSDPSKLYEGAAFDEAKGELHLLAPAYFVNIPIIAWLSAPFTLLPVKQAGNVLLVINILISMLCLLLTQIRLAGYSNRTKWIVTAAFVTSGPLVHALNLGQTTPWILLALLLAEASLHAGKEARAGVWLGLASAIKIPLLLLIPSFSLCRRWRVTMAACAFLVIICAASLLLYDWPLHITYFNHAFRANAGRSIGAHNCQSIDAFVARLFTDVSLWSWKPVILSGFARGVKWLLLSGILAICIYVLRKHPTTYHQMLLQLSAVLCASLAISPVYWIHYGIWLLPVATVVLVVTEGSNKDLYRLRVVWLVAIALALINFPVLPQTIILRLEQHIWFRLAVSHQLFGTLLLLVLCAWILQRLRQAPHQNETQPATL